MKIRYRLLRANQYGNVYEVLLHEESIGEVEPTATKWVASPKGRHGAAFPAKSWVHSSRGSAGTALLKWHRENR